MEIRITHLTYLALGLVMAAASSRGQDGRKPLTPKESVTKMVEAAKRPDAPGFRKLFSSDAFSRVRGAKQDEMRRETASALTENLNQPAISASSSATSTQANVVTVSWDAVYDNTTPSSPGHSGI